MYRACGGVRGEVKHLSTRRKRYSVSSGERKRRRLNRVRVILGGGCVCGVVGLVRLFSAGEGLACVMVVEPCGIADRSA